MTEQSKPQTTEPEVIDEAYMERFTDDQLAYKAWIGADLVQEILFDEQEGVEVCMQDARFEAAHAAMALRVLVRRFTGMDPESLRKAVQQRQMEALVLRPEVEQMSAPETLQ
ncbi:hypothetical protein ACI2KS_23835 [Pseudomonas sp. NPDC087358]|uniref:hypothetical protein n=1 Tax=Pseudomonas sp. NPDC087358 TaxID=3364439 RepID=UPI00384C2CC2